MGKSDVEVRGLVAINHGGRCAAQGDGANSNFIHKQVFPSCNFDSIVAWSGRDIQLISRHKSLFDINLIQGRGNSLDPFPVSCHISFKLQLII